MAKKTKKQNKKTQENKLPENMLPQNILPIGERVEEDKNIYISQSVYKEIHKFTKNKTTNESGGMLVGSIIEEFGKTNIVISGFVEAKFSEGTPTTLTFTHETWDYVHKEIEKKHDGKKILGWIHTHPDFGIFLSEYDKFIHQNFFSEPYQVAYVVDPIQNIEGFYFWINGNIERCKGFYIYDKTDTKITVDVEKEEPAPKKEESSAFNVQTALTMILAVVAVFAIFFNISLNGKVNTLEQKYEKLEGQLYNENQLVTYLLQDGTTQTQAIQNLEAEILQLKEILANAGFIIEEPTQPDAPETEGTGESNSTSTTESAPSATTAPTTAATTAPTTNATVATTKATEGDAPANE